MNEIKQILGNPIYSKIEDFLLGILLQHENIGFTKYHNELPTKKRIAKPTQPIVLTDEILQDYKSNMSVTDICLKHNFSRNSLYRMLRKNKIERRNKNGTRN